MGWFTWTSGRTSKQDPHAVVEAALRNIQLAPDQSDIVTSGYIKKLKFDLGKIEVDLEIPGNLSESPTKIRSRCIEALAHIDGLKDFQININSVAAVSSPVSQSTKNPSETKSATSVSNIKNFIAVASGKGGVGKSTAAAGLAYSLAIQGFKVGLLDADLYGPSLSKMTGVSSPTSMNGDLVVPPEEHGIKIMSGAMFSSPEKATILRGPMASQFIKQLVLQVDWGHLDYLLIDYPPGTGDIQLSLSQMLPISGAVIVTTPQDIALLDVRKSIAMFNTMNVPILGILENMSYFVCDGCEKKHPLFGKGGAQRLAQELGVALLGQLPILPELGTACDRGQIAVYIQKQSGEAEGFRIVAASIKNELNLLARQDSDVDQKLGTLPGKENFRLEWRELS